MIRTDKGLAAVQLLPGTDETRCPYFAPATRCEAALFSSSPSTATRAIFCGSEDYDRCPIFLAKVLRRI